MNAKLIIFLQKSFKIIGWSILGLALMNIAKEAFEFFRPISEMTQLHQKRDFQFMKSVADMFSYLAQAYFALLISAVFDMVFHRAPVRSIQGDRFLLLTCVGFFIEGVLSLVSWVQTLSYYAHFEFSWLGVLGVGAFVLGAAPGVISFVYAISIFVLFRHFSQMVTFEAEVV